MKSDDQQREYTASDVEEVKKIERLLGAAEGSLKPAGPYRLDAGDCVSCGRTLTFYDFVFTALVDANHPKSYIYDILTGDKQVLQPSRRVRCSSCSTVTSQKGQYWCKAYACVD